MRLEIYSDGAAIQNGRAGGIGYAAVLLTGGVATGYTGEEWQDPSSSNLAELKAILLGLEKTPAELRRETDLHLYTDSDWAVNVIRGKYQATAHQELIAEARAYLRLFRTWELGWVRGHCGHQYNEQAHRLANAAAKRAERGTSKWPTGSEPVSVSLPPSTPLSASVKSRPRPTPKRPPVSRDLGQARLDAIAFPSFAWNRENCRWQSRYSNGEEWSLETLQERRTRLLADIQALESLVRQPPAEWDGVRWTELHERLRGWQGHLNALDQTLSNRGRGIAAPRRAPSSWSSGCAPSMRTEAPGQDPFQWE